MVSRPLRHRNVNAIAMPGKPQARKATQAAAAWPLILLPPNPPTIRRRFSLGCASQASRQAGKQASRQAGKSHGPSAMRRGVRGQCHWFGSLPPPLALDTPMTAVAPSPTVVAVSAPSPMVGAAFTSDRRDAIGCTRKIIDDNPVDWRGGRPRYPCEPDTCCRQTNNQDRCTMTSPCSQPSIIICKMLRPSWRQALCVLLIGELIDRFDEEFNSLKLTI
jgi:hypothetical protein